MDTYGLPAGPVVKICGLTRVEDVVLAAELGAWALGFVFAPSPRRLTPAAARGLIAEAAERLARGTVRAGGAGRARLPLTVGVFGDAPADEIAEVAGIVGLDAVQLHGADCRDGSAAAAVRAALLQRQVLARQARPAAPGSRQASCPAHHPAARRSSSRPWPCPPKAPTPRLSVMPCCGPAYRRR